MNSKPRSSKASEPYPERNPIIYQSFKHIQRSVIILYDYIILSGVFMTCISS